MAKEPLHRRSCSVRQEGKKSYAEALGLGGNGDGMHQEKRLDPSFYGGNLASDVQLEELQDDWLKGSFVGKLREVCNLQDAIQNLALAGSLPIQARHMGDNLVLLTGVASWDLNQWIKDEKEWMDELFFFVKPWNPSLVPRCILAWIRCEGVPLNL